MPPTPVIPFTWRIKIPWTTVNGVQPINVFHVSGPWETADEVGDDLDSALDPDMFDCVSSAWTFNTLNIMPLDGETASVDYTLSSTYPGGSSGQSIVNLSGMVEFRTLIRGSRGRGRLFLGPTTESVNDGTNAMNTTVRLSVQTAWNGFQGALLGLATPGSLVVASYVHQSIAPVQSITVDDILRSTKSRLNQITR